MDEEQIPEPVVETPEPALADILAMITDLQGQFKLLQETVDTLAPVEEAVEEAAEETPEETPDEEPTEEEIKEVDALLQEK